MKLIEIAKKLGIDVSAFTDADGKVDEASLSKEIAKVQKENPPKEEDDDGDKKTDEDVDYWKNEFEQAKKKRDDAKKEARKLREEFEALKESLKAKPDPEEFNKTKEELEELRQFKSELEKQKEEAELQAMTEAERREVLWKKQMEEFKSQYESKLTDFQKKFEERDKEVAEKEQQIKLLRQHQLSSELLIAAKNNKAINPVQIQRILEREFVYDSNSQKFIKEEKDKNGKIVDLLEIDEYVKKFLEDDNNSNLVESDIPYNGNRGGSKIPPTQPTKLELTAEQEKDMKNNYNFNDPEKYLKMVSIRDEKLGKKT